LVALDSMVDESMITIATMLRRFELTADLSGASQLVQ